MYKTVRKYYGEAIVVTQEVDDIISSPVVKESIINNSDCKILLEDVYKRQPIVWKRYCPFRAFTVLPTCFFTSPADAATLRNGLSNL